MKKLLSIILVGLIIVTSVSFAFAAEEEYYIDEYGVIYSADKTTLIKYPNDLPYVECYKIPEGVTTIKKEAFSELYSKIGTIVLPGSIETFERSAFFRNTFKGIVILDGIQEITFCAFENCGFDTLIIASSVTRIDSDGFWNCGPLTEADYHYLGNKDNVYIGWGGAVADFIHYSTEIAETPATCTGEGVEAGLYCEDCDKYIVGGEAIPVDADNHDIVVDQAVAPTCTETGLTEGQHCSRCDNATVAQQEIPVVDHADEDGDNICDNGGEQLICEDCGRPVHEGQINGYICMLITFIKLVVSFFKTAK